MQNEAELLIDKLFNYFGVADNIELAEKMNTTRQTITNWKSRKSVNAIKKKCRQLGIYREIFDEGIIIKENNVDKKSDYQKTDNVESNNDILKIVQALNNIAEVYGKEDELKEKLSDIMVELVKGDK